MTLESKIANAFRLNDENWMRHANPLSVWTRYTVLPLIVIAVWSKAWIGWWCLVPVLLSFAWMVINPILFQKPKSTKNWASKAVLGERIYLNRDSIKLPEHHCVPLYSVLNILAAIGLLMAFGAVYFHSVSTAVVGIILAYLSKSWFLDRMVWLYEDMKTQNETYRSWEY